MENNGVVRASLWSKESKNGIKYANGKVVLCGKVYRCILFTNKKKSDKSPDFTILFQ